LNIDPEALARLIFDQRGDRHSVIGVKLVARQGQVLVRVMLIEDFGATALALVLATMFLAQARRSFLRIALAQVDVVVSGYRLRRHHGREHRRALDRVQLRSDGNLIHGQYRWQHEALLSPAGLSAQNGPT
jgi:hypothetical protein